jgi:hypothetical protein
MDNASHIARNWHTNSNLQIFSYARSRALGAKERAGPIRPTHHREKILAISKSQKKDSI